MAPKSQAAYSREFAPQYEANIVPRFRPIAERLAELAQPKAGDRAHMVPDAPEPAPDWSDGPLDPFGAGSGLVV